MRRNAFYDGFKRIMRIDGGHRVTPMAKPALSIIIPALNEATTIAATLTALQPVRRRGAEIVVVDGGSDDEAITIATPLANHVISAPRGRGAQMNAGAASATGDIL